MAVNIDSIETNGVVGAGGAGFPTHVKMKAKARYLILNAAECEPLLHKDKELLINAPDQVIAGMKIAAEMIGASECIIGIKEKYEHVIDDLKRRVPAGFRVHPLRDCYPAGDEFVLTYDCTGRIIPPGGLPIHVGCVVNNVETMFNLAADRPVTHKYLTVTGAVKTPVTLCVPLGVSVGEVIEAAGGPTIDDWTVVLNGVMMGRTCDDLTAPVTKTSGGVYVFPRNHVVPRRLRADAKTINKIGKSACDQCTFCTELCPRYLLGHPIEPHKAMRGLLFAVADMDPLIIGTPYCCECNLCTMIACPEDLDPRRVCIQDKAVVRERGIKWQPSGQIKAHPMNDARRTPTNRLMTKLGLKQFINKGPLREGVLKTSRVRLPLRQHVGAPAEPVVAVGTTVRAGTLIARVPKDKLGANIHASIAGVISSISNEMIEITS